MQGPLACRCMLTILVLARTTASSRTPPPNPHNDSYFGNILGQAVRELWLGEPLSARLRNDASAALLVAKASASDGVRFGLRSNDVDNRPATATTATTDVESGGDAPVYASFRAGGRRLWHAWRSGSVPPHPRQHN